MALFCFILGQTKSGKSTLIRHLTPEFATVFHYEAGSWARSLYQAQFGEITAEMDHDPLVRKQMSELAVSALSANHLVSFEAFQRFLSSIESSLTSTSVVFVAGVRNPEDFMLMTRACRGHTLAVLDVQSEQDGNLPFDDGLTVIRQYIQWRVTHFKDIHVKTVSESAVLDLNKGK